MSTRQIHTVGSKRRTPKYLGAVAMVVVLGGLLSLPIINTAGLDKQQAMAEVIVPQHNWKLNVFSSAALLELDKSKNQEIQVRIVDGPHAGEMAVAHYGHLEKWMGSSFDGAETLTKGTRVNIEYTQRRITDNLRVASIKRAGP